MRRTGLLCGSAATLAFVSSEALAQASQPARDTESTVAEIVVTATRSETPLSKTPIAMSAISGSELSQAGVSNATQLGNLVPDVSLVRNGVNGLQVTIRGVTSSDGTEKGDPSAAVMLDGIYIARPQAQEVSFFDLSRVEVLRGPQGTLYGRNTTAGVINIISALPTRVFETSADVSYESYDHVETSVMANVPVRTDLAVRVAANIDRRDSYIIDKSRDGFTSGPFKDNRAIRASALYEPSDKVRLVVRGDYADLQGNPLNSVPTANFFKVLVDGSGNPIAEQTPAHIKSSATAERTTTNAQGWQGYRNDRTGGVMGELTVRPVDKVSIVYLGGYRTTDLDQHDTFSGTGLPYSVDSNFTQQSHELRFAYEADALKVQVGGYYFKEQGSANFLFWFGPQPTSFGLGFEQTPVRAESKSVFGQATYTLAPRLKLTAGIRASHDVKSREGVQVFLSPPANLLDPSSQTVIGSPNDAHATFEKTTWRVGLDYDVSDLGLLYASVSTGYKAGGFNDGCEIGTQPSCLATHAQLYYQPETVTAYEAGYKFKFSPAFQMNATAFHYDYQGLQLTSLQPVCVGGQLCSLTTNAGRAKVDGVELEAVIRPAPHHEIDLSPNYLNARYVQYFPVPSVSYAGRPLARSPKYTFNAGYSFTKPLGDDRSIVFSVRSHISSSYDLTDLSSSVHFKQPSFTSTDVSINYNGPNNRYYFGVFARNLENNIVLTNALAVQGSTSVFADPRVIGARFGFRM